MLEQGHSFYYNREGWGREVLEGGKFVGKTKVMRGEGAKKTNN